MGTEFGKTIQVLVVDDSAFMRKALSNMLSKCPDFKVIGTARNGDEALRKVDELKPDVMTLDIDMPVMDGLMVLERVMATHPLPVVVVSGLTEEGAEVTLRALELGAIDFIPKHLEGSSLNISTIQEQLIEKVKVAAGAAGKISRRSATKSSESTLGSFSPESKEVEHASSRGNIPWGPGDVRRRVPGGPQGTLPGILTIGCSTGGPQALQEMLPRLPASFPASIVVVQHMPKFFTKPFAERLNQLCPLEVREAEEGDEVLPGVVLIAPGGQHLTLEKRGSGKVTIHVSEEPSNYPYRPSADLMMQSAVKVFGSKTVGVIMTGMGQDGFEGAQAIKAVRGRILAQDSASCVVYGMPKAVIEGGWADKIVPLSRMPREIMGLFQQKENESPVLSLTGGGVLGR